MAHEEESEFDREDEHDENDCGHTDEEHRQIKERGQRLQKNMKQFLVDNAEDMLEPGTYEKLIKKIEKRLRAEGINPSLANLKVFREGFEFGMAAHINVGGNIGPIFAGINKMIADREKKAKPVIDITKSVPLPPNEPPKEQ